MYILYYVRTYLYYSAKMNIVCMWMWQYVCVYTFTWLFEFVILIDVSDKQTNIYKREKIKIQLKHN